MKTIKLIIIGVFVALNMNAQIKVLPNGDCGIGTTSPEYRVDIDGGNIRFQGHDKAFFLGYKSDIIFWHYDLSEEHGRIWSDGYALQLRAKTGYDITIKRDNGYVGINDNSPSYMLDVNGDIATYGVLRIGSDIAFKKNIEKLDNSLTKVSQLNGVSYNPIVRLNTNDSTSAKSSIDNTMDTSTISERIGFIAQEVQKIFPELVDQDNEGYLNIDYIGLIPVLVEAIKEQQNKIEELEKKVGKSDLKSATNPSSGNLGEDTDNESHAVLYQNVPNPYKDKTEISFFIPGDISMAFLNIYNMQGTQIKSYTISERGNASIIVNGSELQPGMYLYTLIADDKEIDTKRMILTD